MNFGTEAVSRHRPRLVTIIVALLLVAGIILANLSSEPVTDDLIKRIANKPERAYGWPVTWYWRIASTVPGGVRDWWGAPRPALQWPVARYSARDLIANLAVWLVLVVGVAAACQRLLHKWPYQLRWRPRVTTLIVLLAIAVPTVLANMTFEMSWPSPYRNGPGATANASFGWPLAWNRYIVAPYDNVYGWDFSAARLSGNVAIWLGMLVLAGLLCEWLLRRYGSRFRFSLRAMLAAIALIAILCTWCSAIWKRAQEQDAVAASIGNIGSIWVERSGPKWLGVVVPDRFRRRVVGVSISVGRPSRPGEVEQEQNAEDNHESMQDNEERDSDADEQGSHLDGEVRDEDEDRTDEKLLRRLARLPLLRFLKIDCEVLTPSMADALAELRQLRRLHVGMQDVGWRDRRSSLTWLASLGQLEQVSLRGVDSDDLTCLAGLRRLKLLTLDFSDCQDDESETEKRLVATGKLRQLRRLRVEGFSLSQVARLRGLTNLKSLTLDFYQPPA